MKKKRYSTEQILAKVREIGVGGSRCSRPAEHQVVSRDLSTRPTDMTQTPGRLVETSHDVIRTERRRNRNSGRDGLNHWLANS